jgi:hypothetical protein
VHRRASEPATLLFGAVFGVLLTARDELLPLVPRIGGGGVAAGRCAHDLVRADLTPRDTTLTA